MNPNDHTDHIATASAIRSITMNKFTHYQWLSYYSYYCPKNIFSPDLKNKCALFKAYCKKTENHPYAKEMQSFRENEWRCWGDKSYCRVIMPYNNDVGLYPTPYFLPHCFDLSHLDKNDAEFQRCETIAESIDESDFYLINLFTQKRIQLDAISKIIWMLLSDPISLNDLVDIFMNAYPNESIANCKNLILATLQLFLSHRFINLTNQYET